MSKNFKISLFPAILFAISLLFLPAVVRADVCSQNTSLDLVARDPGGSYIPGARVEVYKQELDANGHAKPTTRFASATTDAVLGTAHLSWRNSSVLSDTYAIKIQTISKDAATFWYYGYTLGCGQGISLNQTLSGILFVLHDADGNLLRNTSFNVYSQLYDASNNPLKEKKELLTTLNSGYAGQVKVYLPQGSVRSIDNSLSDHYALELSRTNGKFSFYNIFIHDGQLTNVDYYLSSLRIKLQDTTGALFPANTKVEVFKQEVGPDNEHQKGAKAGEFSIGDDGYGSIEIAAGVYVLGVKGKNNQYQYFWDIEAQDGRTTEYSLAPSQGWTPSEGSCANNSQLFITLRSLSGDITPGLKFELYEQKSDANGLPIAGNKISGGTIDSTGRALVTFRPDPRQVYALKVWDRRADLGDFWFFDAVRFVCNYDRALTKYVTALKIVLRDGQGKLKKNTNFSLYAQKYDADQNPIFEDSDLIASLKTDSGGQARIYVAAYNPYRNGQTGFYALTTKDASGNLATAYNIRVLPDRDYTFQYRFSSLSGEFRDARKKLLANKEVRIYEQLGSGSDRDLGKLLVKVKTGNTGRWQLEYPTGTYALAVSDDFNRENITWNVVVKSGKTNTVKLVTNLTKFSLADAQGEAISKDASLKLYSLSSDDGLNFYRDNEVGTIKLAANKTATLSIAPGYYLAVYTDKNQREYGRYFKANNSQFQTVLVSTSAKNRLKADQVFKIGK